MNTDPSRIPAILKEVQETWEGQPDLSLTALFGILQNQGIGWGSDDEQLVEALRTMREKFPAVITGPRFNIEARFVVETANPNNTVTVDPFRMVVRRRSSAPAVQPGIWDYAHVQCRVGAEFIVKDTEEFEHHLGTVKHIRLIDANPQPSVSQLNNVTRADVGERAYALKLIDDTLIVIDSKVRVFTQSRRELHYEEFSWKALRSCEPGRFLAVHTAAGTRTIGDSEIASVFEIE